MIVKDKIVSRQNLWKKWLTIALLVYCILIFIQVARNSSYQWDFKAYYWAAKASLNGINPYNSDAITQFAQMFLWKFVYPPVTIPVFQLIALLDFSIAFYLWLFLKGVALISLLHLWRKQFLENENSLFFYFFCLLAFDSTIYLDFIAGNVSIFEQLLLWLAFYFFLKQRWGWFCVFVLIASIFKFLPVLFLCLLWFAKDKRKSWYFGASSGAFLIFLLLNYLLVPTLTMNFFSNAASIDGRGVATASTLPLIKDIFDLRKIPVPALVPFALYFLVVLVTLFISWRAYKSLTLIQFKDKTKIAIFFGCLVYALIVPRLQDYSYILLLVPTYFILSKIDFLNLKPYYFVLLIVFFPSAGRAFTVGSDLSLPGATFLVELFWLYYPLMVAYLVWFLYLRYISKLAKLSQVEPDTPLL